MRDMRKAARIGFIMAPPRVRDFDASNGPCPLSPGRPGRGPGRVNKLMDGEGERGLGEAVRTRELQIAC